MITAVELRYPCQGRDQRGQRQTYTILASQTLRPQIIGGIALGARLEWQFYIEELAIVVERVGSTRYVDIDNPSRTYLSSSSRQPPFEEQRQSRNDMT